METSPRMAGFVSGPLLGRYGTYVVGGLCGFEIVGLFPGSPSPTISQLVKRHPAVGLMILAALVHHWFLEAERAEFLEILESCTD